MGWNWPGIREISQSRTLQDTSRKLWRYTGPALWALGSSLLFDRIMRTRACVLICSSRRTPLLILWFFLLSFASRGLCLASTRSSRGVASVGCSTHSLDTKPSYFPDRTPVTDANKDKKKG